MRKSDIKLNAFFDFVDIDLGANIFLENDDGSMGWPSTLSIRGC